MRQKGSGEDYITRNFMICIPHQILFGYQIKKNEMGGTCSLHEGRERCIRCFGREASEEDHLGYREVDGMIL